MANFLFVRFFFLNFSNNDDWIRKCSFGHIVLKLSYFASLLEAFPVLKPFSIYFLKSIERWTISREVSMGDEEEEWVREKKKEKEKERRSDIFFILTNKLLGIFNIIDLLQIYTIFSALKIISPKDSQFYWTFKKMLFQPISNGKKNFFYLFFLLEVISFINCSCFLQFPFQWIFFFFFELSLHLNNPKA